MVMRSPRRILALWALLLSFLVAVPAAQASVVTVTASGIISYEEGDFSVVTGSPAPATLIGTAVTITQIFSDPVVLDDAGGVALFAGVSIEVAVSGFASVTFTPIADPSNGGLIMTLYDAGSPPADDLFFISAQGGGFDANGFLPFAVVSGGALDPADKNGNVLVDRTLSGLVTYMGSGPSLGFSLADANYSTVFALNADNVRSLTVEVTEVTAVPEPGSLALLAVGAAGLLLVRRRTSVTRVG